MRRNHRLRRLLLATLLLAFALRLYRLDFQELRGDEAFGYFFSLRPLAELVPATLALQEPHPVASYYLQHGWLGWAGDSEFALRFPGVWFGTVAVALLSALGRQLLRMPAAFVATLFLTLSPYAIWHSQDARMYSMSLALTIASTWLMVLWLQRQRYSLAFGYIVVSWLALHTHYFAVFVLAAQNLFMLIRIVGQPRLRMTFVNWLILQATVIFFYGPWLLRVQGILGNYGGNGDSPLLSAMFRRAISVFVVGESVPVTQQLWWAGCAGGVLLLGALALWRQDAAGRRALQLAAAYLFVPLVATWWSAQQRPIFNERYLVAALPGFCLLIGAAVEQWLEGRRWQTRPRNAFVLWLTLGFATAALGGMMISLNHHYFDPTYSKTRGWRELASALHNWSAGLPTDQVRIAQNFPDPTLWYYYRGPVEHVVLPPQPHDTAGAQATVADLVDADVQRVLLPRQPAANWDTGSLATDALATAFFPVVEQPVAVWPVLLYSRQWVELRPLAVSFANGLHLTGFALSPAALVAEGMLVVHLDWRGTNATLTGTEKVFVQLLNPEGQLVAQDDRAFVLADSATEVQTLYGILLPASLPSGSYRLITGLYNPAVENAPRLLTTAGADFVELAVIEK